MAHGVVSYALDLVIYALDLVKHALNLVIYALDSVIYALDPVNHALHLIALRGAGSFSSWNPRTDLAVYDLKMCLLGCLWQPTILRDSNPQKPPKRRRG